MDQGAETLNDELAALERINVEQVITIVSWRNSSLFGDQYNFAKIVNLAKIANLAKIGASQDSRMGAQMAPRRVQMGAKIHEKSHFWASGTPLLQPTGSRDAQEGVNHPKWTPKSSQNNPKTMQILQILAT